MSPRDTQPEPGCESFPRVSGDEPCPATVIPEGGQFSPRERG